MSVPPPPLPGWFVHTCEFLVEEQDIDMLGHLNNIAAMSLFERARWRLLTDRGHGMDHLNATRQAPVIVAVDAHFRKEVQLRQRVVIETYTSALGTRTRTVTQVMRAEDGTVHIVANYTLGLFDLATRRLILPTPAWRFATGDPEVPM